MPQHEFPFKLNDNHYRMGRAFWPPITEHLYTSRPLWLLQWVDVHSYSRHNFFHCIELHVDSWAPATELNIPFLSENSLRRLLTLEFVLLSKVGYGLYFYRDYSITVSILAAVYYGLRTGQTSIPFYRCLWHLCCAAVSQPAISCCWETASLWLSCVAVLALCSDSFFLSLSAFRGSHRCAGCDRKLPQDNSHTSCVLCLGAEHAKAAVDGSTECDHCLHFSLHTRKRRSDVLMADGSCHSSATERSPHRRRSPSSSRPRRRTPRKSPTARGWSPRRQGRSLSPLCWNAGEWRRFRTLSLRGWTE